MKTITIGSRIIAPSKIVCVGRNYAEHARELGNEVPDDIVLFIKPNSAISEQLYSGRMEPLHYEGEISLVYEKGRFAAAGFGLDLTMRQLQGKLKSKGLPWEKSKSFDNSAVFSSFTEIEHTDGFSVELEINGQIAQKGDISQMIYKPKTILEEVLKFFTLQDGDIVMTGTPAGVASFERGDRFKGTVNQNGRIIASGEWTAE